MRLRAPIAAACLALAGCQTIATKPVVVDLPDPAAAQAAQRARETALGLATGDCAVPNWSMSGRVALSNGKDGGSGRIEWLQGDGRVQVTLSAPITRQNWTLAVDAGEATLDGVPNGPLSGPDAAALLRTATGWDIPVAALGCWVRGAPAPAGTLGASRIEFAASLLPVRLEQGGWRVDYADWKVDGVSGLSMPGRINAQRGEDRVRLVVDRWDAPVE